MFRFFIFAYFSWFCFLHIVRKAYRKGSGDFGVHKGISPYSVFLCLLVLRLSASTCVRMRMRVHRVRLCIKSGGSVWNTSFASSKREKTEKRFLCSVSGYFALNLITYRLKHLIPLCAYTNKRGKISLLSLYLRLSIKHLKS